jgi:PEP-CTERM motif-containing protein
MLVHRTKFVLAAVGLLMGFAPSAHAAFHLWNITQLYSNPSGTLQFIEMQDIFGGQNFINGQSITALNVGGTLSNTYTINTPGGNPLPGSTLNHFLLFGTAGIQAAGGPAPDFILPNNFLFNNGGTINYFAIGSGNSYPALPTDGISSYLWQGGGVMTPNIAHNFVGGTGTVIGVPEPSTLILTAAGAGLFGWYRRRPQRKSADRCISQS